MPFIYIMLSQTGTSGSVFFKCVTRQPYNHASLAQDSSLRDMVSFGRRRLYNQFVAGLVREQRDTFVYRRFKGTVIKLYRVPCTDAQAAEVRRLLAQEFFPEMQRYKYDFLGLAYRLFSVRHPRKYRYVCSHFVAELIERAGIHRFSADPFFAEPRHFGEIPGAACVYEGLLTAYEPDGAADAAGGQ